MGTRFSPVGHTVDPEITRWIDALSSGDAEAAGSHCSADCRLAFPRRGVIETAPRLKGVGAAGLAAIERDGGLPQQPRRLVVAVHAGDVWLLEGVVLGDTECSFAASVTTADGVVSRHLEFRADSRIGPPGPEPERSDHDAAVALERYFAHLDSGAFEDAAACFALEVLYSHPPYKHTGISDPGRLDIVGRDALLATFRRRGRQPFGHRLISFGQVGRHAMLEGLVEGIPGGGSGSFVSCLSLDARGLIARYVSFYCEPAFAS
ncbi:MAG: hypothetical protein ACPHJY_11750 [Acidimicrobiales bacterium]